MDILSTIAREVDAAVTSLATASGAESLDFFKSSFNIPQITTTFLTVRPYKQNQQLPLTNSTIGI